MLLPRWPRVVATTALCLSIPLVSTTSAWAAPAPANTSPTISDLTDRSNPEDTPEGPIPFVIGDAESGAETLRLTATSSNPSLVPVSGIRFGGSYSNRSVTVVPAANQSGTATITITVSDGSLSRSDSFVQTIRPENDRPTISDVANLTATSGRASGPIAVTLADVDNAASSLTLTARSSNTTLVPASGLVLGGSGANRTLTLTPAAGQTGSATITLTASDGVLTATDTFTVTVTAPVSTTTTTAPAPTTTTTVPTGGTNTRPTISNLTDRSNPEDVPEGPISFTVGDAQTAAGSLTVRGTSSNTTLIPNAGITFGGSGGNRTVMVAPAANQSGTATITITVSDGSLSTSDTFVQTIRPENDTPTISNIANRTTSMGTATGDIPFVVGDVETSASQLTVTGTSNAALVPVSAIDLGGSGANRTIEVTPAAGQTGTATITVGASDGTTAATDAFTLTVSGSGTTTTTTAPPPPTTTTTVPPPPTTTTTAPPPPTTTTTAPPPPTTTTTTAPAPPSAPAGVFASPTGNGSGTASSPASLASVLNGTVRVNAGQTIWLRGGTYTGRFTSNLNGTSSARITIRSYPGETAVINSTNGQGGDVLIVSGSYTDVRDLEVMMSDTNRYPWRDAGITVQGHHNRVINNYIHDTGCGITSFSSATDITIYGNIILNVGSGNASESCHSIYAANSSGTKIIEDNIWWGSGWFGLHLYTEGGSLRGFQIRGNVGAGPNLIGGFAPLDQIDVDDNDFDHLQIGYGADQNGSVNVRNNRLGWSPDGRALSVFRLYDQLTVTGNTMYGHTNDGVRFENSAGVAPSSNATWNGNTYYRLGFAYPTSPGEWPCCGQSFGTWRNQHPGWDTTSSWSSGAPSNSLTINPNQYEAGRATVVAHTYNGASTVSVNPSSFLASGARYVVINAFNPTAAPVASGTYSGGSISLPTSLSTASPIGMPVDSNPTPITSIYVIRTV
jgi:hypothetical protein